MPSAKALARIEERIGLGPRYAYELMLDLARPWIIPVRTVAVTGNYGDRSFPPAGPEYTECRPSHAGQVVIDAEARRLAPVPVGLINGTAYRGGTQPPLDPFRVLAALRRLLEDARVPDGDLIGVAGPPWSGTHCTVTGDLDALARGRRVVLREAGRITITGVPSRMNPRVLRQHLAIASTTRTGGQVRPLRRTWLSSHYPPRRSLPRWPRQSPAGRHRAGGLTPVRPRGSCQSPPSSTSPAAAR